MRYLLFVIQLFIRDFEINRSTLEIGLDWYFFLSQRKKKIEEDTSICIGASQYPPDTCIEMGSSLLPRKKPPGPKGVGRLLVRVFITDLT